MVSVEAASVVSVEAASVVSVDSCEVFLIIYFLITLKRHQNHPAGHKIVLKVIENAETRNYQLLWKKLKNNKYFFFKCFAKNARRRSIFKEMVEEVDR